MKTLVVFYLILLSAVFRQGHGACRPGRFKPKNPLTTKQSTSSLDEATTSMDIMEIFGITTALTTQATPISTLPYDPIPDAVISLHQTLNFVNVNSSAIIDILANRNRNQRLEIVKQYKRRFQENLVEVLNSKLNGELSELINALLTPLMEYYARELFTAMHGSGADEHCLIDIIPVLNNEDMKAVRSIYEEMFGEPLGSCIKRNTIGGFKELLVSLTKAGRRSSFSKDEALKDAIRLVQANNSDFIEILTSRSSPQLRSTFDEYKSITGHSLDYTIVRKFSSDLKHGLLAVMSAIGNRPNYFAQRLRLSMVGFGMRSTHLTRIMVMINSSEMEDVKVNYEKNYGIRLEEVIEDETSGSYRECLLALLRRKIL